MGYKVNLVDFAVTIDIFNTFIRLNLSSAEADFISDLRAQFDIIKYRSAETINDYWRANCSQRY